MTCRTYPEELAEGDVRKGLVCSVPPTLEQGGLHELFQLVPQCALGACIHSEVPGGVLVQFRVKDVGQQPEGMGRGRVTHSPSGWLPPVNKTYQSAATWTPQSPVAARAFSLQVTLLGEQDILQL